MSSAAVDPVAPQSSVAERPYRCSWIDHLVRWIDRLPLPAWLFYLLLTVALSLWSHVVLWLDGSLEVGNFLRLRLADGGYEVFFLAFYHYLSVAARRGFRQFETMLDATEAELRALEYSMTHLPRWLGRLSIPLGVGLAVAGIRSDPISFGLFGNHTWAPTISTMVLTGASFSCLFLVLFQSIRQLRLVNTLHARATDINLFQLGPAQALSGLTARTGFGLIAFITYSRLVEGPGINNLVVGSLLVMGILAVVVFVIPLLGMRSRLSAEQARLVSEVNARLQRTIQQIHEHVDAGQHEEVARLRTTMSALNEERQLIEGISTWPWRTSTFRGFASTLLLPIVLWLVQRLLARLV